MEGFILLCNKSLGPRSINYQDLYQIDEVASEYQALIIAANHSFVNKTGFVSEIRLRVREIKQKKFRCEFVLKDYSICDSITKISLKGELFPTITPNLEMVWLSVNI